METKMLFVVTVYNAKRDAFTERLVKAYSKKDALMLVTDVRKASPEDVERLLTKAD